jgi:hypoxanthine-guanine phosphoribosyltransferase
MEKLSTPEDIYLVIDKEDLEKIPKDLAEEIKKFMKNDDVIIVAIA